MLLKPIDDRKRRASLAVRIGLGFPEPDFFEVPVFEKVNCVVGGLNERELARYVLGRRPRLAFVDREYPV